MESGKVGCWNSAKAFFTRTARPPNTTPSASLLSTLPPELICQVFESADGFSMMAALAQTAPVAARDFPNLTEAERLLDVQEEAEAANQSQDGHERNFSIRAKRLLFNARCASAASTNWTNLCRIHRYSGRNEALMQPYEIARFEHAFYCVWTVRVMGTTPHLQDQASAFLAKFSPRELFKLDELQTWATYYNDSKFGSPGLRVLTSMMKFGRLAAI
ncbi:hypothetical protein P280DRAFT_514915 [Massarina eburnea CBS 473.64]|uniref:Uncharacterized protein n=1 Tax=Massarina eburnea CBS 473.64 TaxID=1395130 RepID=A0A6A6S9P7_9PLEO|nr:hypothetical protein P280DRAFT_514915 [Massarina eburnea CBS 473.64]